MTYEYVHLPQGEDIGPEGRAYRATETVLEHNEKHILFLNSEASEISFCDGRYASSLSSINVKGYVVNWKYKEGEHGKPISHIEPVRDETAQEEITRILQAQYGGSQIVFT